MILDKKLRYMRRAARVERYHTMPTVKPQSVGQHTFSAMALLDLCFPDARKEVWRAMLYHDAPECITGDTPATVKWRHTAIEDVLKSIESKISLEFQTVIEITDEERQHCKFCDLMELVIFSIEEFDMGNKLMAVVAINGMKAISDRGLASINQNVEFLCAIMTGSIERRHMYQIAINTDYFNGWALYAG